MRVCNNRWVINISQFLNFLICDDYESLLSECPVQRRSSAVEKSCTSFQQQSIYIHHSTRDKICEFRCPQPAQAFLALFAKTATSFLIFSYPLHWQDKSITERTRVNRAQNINELAVYKIIYIFMNPTNFTGELSLHRHTLFTKTAL